MEMSDPAILQRLGDRQKRIRIRRKMTQGELAEQSGVSLLTVSNFEKGKSITVANLIKILRTLSLLENLDNLLPEQKISPIQLKEWLAKQGKMPKRVRKSTKKSQN